jgi:UDP-2-acetamido-3-amino-2,3-dideoxy-glucuronate N-acetyltransferase
MTQTTSVPSRVRGVRFYQMRTILDQARGHLTVGEFGAELPFLPRRYFVTYDIPDAAIRGEHAHRECHQFLICLRGQCSVDVEDGQSTERFLLDSPNVGLYVPPLVWATEHQHSADSRLMVFASHAYDSEDYIRDKDEFHQLVKGEDLSFKF